MILDSPLLYSSRPSPLQSQVDALVGGFVHQATDWRSLAAMTAGGVAYRTAKIGVMSLGGGQAVHALSVGMGLTAEVSAFELTNRWLSTIFRRGGPVWPPALGSNRWHPHGGAPTNDIEPNLWKWSGSGGLSEGFIRSLITFGTLKGAGHLARGENLLVQHLFQDTAMVTGHQAAGILGLAPRPTNSLAEQFLHAEATTLQLGVGMTLAHRFAPGIHTLERGLDLSLRSMDVGARSPRPQLSFGTGEETSPLQNGYQPALAEAGRPPRSAVRFTDPLVDSQWALMSSTDGKGGGEGRRPFWLSLVLGPSEARPTPLLPRPNHDSPSELESLRLIRSLDEAVVEEMVKDSHDSALERQERLHSVLTLIARTPSDSPARRHFVEMSRSEMARVLRLLGYLETPFSLSPLRVVGRFRLSSTVRELIEETEARRSFGSDFLSYEVVRPQGTRVIRSRDGQNSSALILRSTLALRQDLVPRRPKNFPSFKLSSIYKSQRAETQALSQRLDAVLSNTVSTLPGLKSRYPRAEVLRLELELWPPKAYQTRRRVLLYALLFSLNRMIERPEGQDIFRVKIEVKGLNYSEDLNFIRSMSTKGVQQFIQETPTLPEE